MTEPKCPSTEERLTSVVYPYNGVFDNWKEWSTDTSYNINEPLKHDAKEASHKIPRGVGFHLCEMSRIDKSIDTENRFMAARGFEKEGLGSDC